MITQLPVDQFTIPSSEEKTFQEGYNLEYPYSGLANLKKVTRIVLLVFRQRANFLPVKVFTSLPRLCIVRTNEEKYINKIVQLIEFVQPLIIGYSDKPIISFLPSVNIDSTFRTLKEPVLNTNSSHF